jgi:hypothetical protein
MTLQIHHGSVLLLGDLEVTFQRTLRIPDDGKTYPLPPGLGHFPLRRVHDYATRVPPAWLEHGGVFLPMYQREAMWLNFGGAPHALKVGIGKVCAISGERWREGLCTDPQDYVVTGTQPWLDGIAAGEGMIKQFVAMPLGGGYTVEAQLTGEEKHGGIQLQAYPAKPGRLPRYAADEYDCDECCSFDLERATGEMGLAAGGRMAQKIYPDPYGVDVWDLAKRERVYVHIVNSERWRAITGEAAPATPVSAKSYCDAGLPWFALYDEHAKTIAPTAKLAGVKSIKDIEDAPVSPGPIKKLHKKGMPVDDGSW